MGEIVVVGTSYTSVVPPNLFLNNLGATHLFANLVLHSSMKHLAIDYQFVCDSVHSFELHIAYVSTGDQLANALTEPLSRYRLFYL